MKPLEGVTILDLARVLAAPCATMILAELGATVIKVEQPGKGDEIRAYEPLYKGESACFFTANRSKQSLTVNLKDKRGQEIVRGLARQADVFVENFTVGTLRRMGLDYEPIRAVNPRIVYLSVTGFGQTGPYADRRSYDTVFQAMTGMMGLTGEIGGGPVKAGLPIADLSSGLWAALSILVGLMGRARTGEGCHIDLSMTDAQVSMLTIAAARLFALGEVPGRMGTEHPGRIPSAAFQCGDGGRAHITGTDAHWPKLCRVLGLEEWGRSPKAVTNAARLKHRTEVMETLRAAIRSWKRDALVEACVAAGVPAGPIYAVDEVLADPHFQARGVVSRFDYAPAGSFPALPVPLWFTGLDSPSVGPPPMLGEHTEAILRERLGMDAGTIATLRAEGVI
jgi:crotonobetainyl-CoA:carnitine CoA-transferase CaiB-like acyl-CoA transferase